MPRPTVRVSYASSGFILPDAMKRMSADNRGGFPATRISAIVAASSSDRGIRARGLEAVAAAYRLPVYKYIRLRWKGTREEAEDRTQGFFTEAIDKNWFARYEPDRARFRTFLRSCLDAYLANEAKSAARIKRGGDATIVTFDFEEAERGLAGQSVAAHEIDAYFEREFVRSLYSIAVDRLRDELGASGKGIHFVLFEEYVLADAEAGERPGYRELAERHGLPVTTVTNHLAGARRCFRRILLEALRELTATDEEFRSEARALLGVEPE